MKNNKINKLNKKVITSLALGGLIIVAPLTTFAFVGNQMENTLGLNHNNYEDCTNIDILSDEMYLELAIAKSELKMNQLNKELTLLENSGVDISNYGSILEDYEELLIFLNSANVNEVTKNEIQEVFFEMNPEFEEMSELRDLLRENIQLDELQLLKDSFKEEMNLIDEEFGIENTQRNMNKRQGQGQGLGHGKNMGYNLN